MSCLTRCLGVCGFVLLSANTPLTLVYAQAGSSSSAAALVLKGETTATDVARDGRPLLFIDWTMGELVIRDLATQMDRRLTPKRPTDKGYPGTAVISRDGQQIAFNWYMPEGLELRVMPVSGGEPRILDAGKGTQSRVHGWTPDGRELLVVRASSLEKTADLGFFHIETGQFRRVAATQGSAHARLSPDGSRIILSELSREDPTQSDIRLIDCATGNARLLLGGRFDDYSPDWAPDGQSIYFLSDRGRKPQLWTLRLAPGVREPEPLHDLVDGDLAIVGVTEDSRVLVDADDIGGTDSYLGVVDWSTGRVTDVRQLRNPPYKGSRRAVPSPDGKRVAFLRRGRGYGVRPGWQIPVVQSDDGRQERVYSTALTLRDEPAWYPDGRALLFAMPPQGAVGDSPGRNWRFVRLDLATGEYRDVGGANSKGLVRMAGLTERSLFYLLSDYSGVDVVRALDWTTGASREVFRPTGSDTVFADVAVLGEGERIALALWRGGKRAAISVITFPGRDPVQVGEVEANSRPQLVWCSDGKSLLVSGRLEGRQGVWRIPVDGGSPQRLSLEETDITEVRLSGDGRRIAFTRRIPRPREVWAYPSSVAKPSEPAAKTASHSTKRK